MDHYYRINRKRLADDIASLGEVGRKNGKGLYRMAFTEEDALGRAWFKSRLREAGLEVCQDGAANLHGRLGWDGKSPSIMIGSHLDTVPDGGAYDGALGVLVGLECLRRIKEEQVPVACPLEVVSFSDEEGRFGGMLGSQAVAGLLKPEFVTTAADIEGVSLLDAVRGFGGSAEGLLNAGRSSGSIRAYLELHIEQGPLLENIGASVGVVRNIAGILKWKGRFTGTPNHAGATPMSLRKDAFATLALCSAGLPELLEKYGSKESVATIGYVKVHPGAANVIPGQVDFTVEVREPKEEILTALSLAVSKFFRDVADKANVAIDFMQITSLPPVLCDAGLVSLLERIARDFGVEQALMSSGAAHDAQNIATIAPMAMLFVPSKEGRSHCPAEYSSMDDIEAGANIMLNAIIALANA